MGQGCILLVRLMIDLAIVTDSAGAAEGYCNLTEGQHTSTIHVATHSRRGTDGRITLQD
jgi:hypothetical protein